MRMKYLVEGGRRLGLLTSPRGGGKSLLLAVFAERVRQAGDEAVLVGLRDMWSEDLAASLLTEMGIAAAGEPRYQQWQALTDRLDESRYLKRRTVLLLDDIDAATRDMVNMVLRLCEYEQPQENSLTIIASASEPTWKRLDPALLERVDLLVDLPLWHANDATNFVCAALARAGRADELFRPEALARLHTLSAGLPRRLNQLAELALLAGAAEQAKAIDAATVDAVFEELHLAGRPSV